MLQTETSDSVVDRIVAAFNAGDVNAFADCFSEDAVQYHPFFPEPMRGREAIRAAEGTLFAGFDQIRLEAITSVTSGDITAAEFQVHAVHSKPLVLPDGTVIPPTGCTIDLPMAAFLRLDGEGQIVESHRYQDSLSMMRALGLA